MDIKNFSQSTPNLACCGQPSHDSFKAIREAGFMVVINLGINNTVYSLNNERELVTSFGLSYHTIPVEFDKPLLTDLIQFFNVMDCNFHKTLVHCASNYRASAFVGLWMYHTKKITLDGLNAYSCQFWQPNEIWLSFIKESTEYIDKIL